MTECLRCEVSRHSLWSHCLWCMTKLKYDEDVITRNTLKEMRE